MAKPQVVFIMSPRGSFSPLHSGALSTNLYNCALQARAEGVEPLVVARRGPHAPYPDIPALWVDFPEPQTPAATLLARPSPISALAMSCER